jgi:hypothetical protein
MPFDSWGSYVEGELGDLDEYIEWVGNVLNNQPIPTLEREIRANEIGQKLLRNLRRERDLKQFQLDSHRQRDRESGIKY